MIAFLLLAGITCTVVWRVNRSIGREWRRAFLSWNCAIAFLGLLTSLIYTLDLAASGLEAMPSDEAAFLRIASQYLGSGTLPPYQPYVSHVVFLSHLLSYGSPWLARIAQCLFINLTYSSIVWLLWRKQAPTRAFGYFSWFFAPNGIYYGTATVLTRDILIIYCLGVIGAAAYVLSDTLARCDRRLRTRVVGAIVLAAHAALLATLSPWLVLLAGSAVVVSLFGAMMARRSLRLVPAALLLAGALAVGAYFARGFIVWQYHLNVIEGSLREEQAAMGATDARVDAMDPFRMILGPGLIRPLFYRQYFVVGTASNSAYYWFGVLWWYGNLFVTLPMLARRPLRWLADAQSTYAVMLFLLLMGIYIAAYGGSSGMRKRAMLQFAYTVAVSLAYFAAAQEVKGRVGRRELRLAIPRVVVQLLLVATFALSSLQGVDA